jgi:hypothetical protein
MVSAATAATAPSVRQQLQPLEQYTLNVNVLQYCVLRIALYAVSGSHVTHTVACCGAN